MIMSDGVTIKLSNVAIRNADQSNPVLLRMNVVFYYLTQLPPTQQMCLQSDAVTITSANMNYSDSLNVLGFEHLEVELDIPEDVDVYLSGDIIVSW